MTLLELRDVTKRYRSGRGETVALAYVNLDVSAGEFVVVRGPRRSGRTTLLRVAAGIEPADEGSVRFDGTDLTDARHPRLGTDIGFCSDVMDPTLGETVLDQVAIGPRLRGASRSSSRSAAAEALERAGAGALATSSPFELHPSDLVRVGIARALALSPRMLLLDEPTNGVDIEEREPIVALLGALARAGTGVLVASHELLEGAHRTLSLDHGVLRGDTTPEPAPVLAFRRPGAGLQG